MERSWQDDDNVYLYRFGFVYGIYISQQYS